MAQSSNEVIGQIAFVRIVGVLDGRGAAQVYDDVLIVLRLGAPDVVLDLNDVSSITRVGCRLVNVLAKMHHTQTRRRLTVTCTTEDVQKLLEASCFVHAAKVSLVQGQSEDDLNLFEGNVLARMEAG